MAMSVKASSKETTVNSQAKKLCDHIKLTRKTWNSDQNKAQEGKLYRGRPQIFKPEQARDMQGSFGLQGNRCHIATRITPGLETSTARLAKQRGHNDKQTIILQQERGIHSNAGYAVPKADEILVELHKILVLGDKDPFINAVCTKRRSKPKGIDRKMSREHRRADVKNAYFRKTTRTAGERALDEGKAAISSKQGCAKSKGNNSSETSTEMDNESCTEAERLETTSLELANKECSQESAKKE
ncbi:hypothetical protein OS493_002954 [Desmophyllum pertusum]|uniref:Uncharacterized protein n=1 Tax=Desmophyllum pertusum TaxID=174260 RepID=A0A9X0CI95_9CNID|nr:hypothetical protein OS493_002954 [Desmophyllum pertusum]